MTPKMEKFITEYLVDQNGTQAAKRAGYSGSDKALTTVASKLLAKDSIRSKIDASLELRRKNAARKLELIIIDEDRWLNELAAIGFSDSLDFFNVDENGKLTMTVADIKARGLGRLIKKMTVLPGGKIQFEMHSKLPALEMIAKHFGWIKDIQQHEGAIDVSSRNLTGEDIKNIYKSPKALEYMRGLAELASPPPGRDPAKGDKS